ncbi:chaperone protein dnaJ 11, chloroplastic-like [Rhododendron vialii]|uniref:chaperone protein dnaJ 11, chloroplastic-like n=1 Tax=Rhododendron vialii TaxID=182163 RepID=UPI00265E24A0|nr:chaperone protein dnaJ 11, chloroplastic-like [Rhododendron vialii]
MLSPSLSSPFPRSSSPHVRISVDRSPHSPPSIGFRPPRAAAAASCASPCSSLYEVLGISMGASCQEIKTAYRNLARTCHPDVASAVDREGPSAADEFMKVHAAYSTLSDPGKRADYDRTLFRQYRTVGAYSGISASPTTVMSRFSGYYTPRNWETDQCW